MTGRHFAASACEEAFTKDREKPNPVRRDHIGGVLFCD